MTTATTEHRPITTIAKRAPVQPNKLIMISREGEQALRSELAELLNERDHRLPRRLERAREFGGTTNNDDYLQILEEEAINSAWIRNIGSILASAQVVSPDDADAGVAGLGSIVDLKIAGKRVERRLLGAHEPIGSDGVSAASPIGSAILGAKAGDSVATELPSGKTIELEIIAVRDPVSQPQLTAA